MMARVQPGRYQCADAGHAHLGQRDLAGVAGHHDQREEDDGEEHLVLQCHEPVER